ncbi:MAG: YciI family protein [Pseudomonadota bacterium]
MNAKAKQYAKLVRMGAVALVAGVSTACVGIAQEPSPPPSVPDDIRERASGFLNMELYVYETRLAGAPELMIQQLGPHLDYQVELQEKGIMFGAGPLMEEGDPNGPPIAGMIIVRADSFEEARAIADADPMHSSGARTYTLRKWTLNEGSLDITVQFSGQTAKIE